MRCISFFCAAKQQTEAGQPAWRTSHCRAGMAIARSLKENLLLKITYPQSTRALAYLVSVALAAVTSSALAQSTTGSVFGQAPVAGGETVQVRSSTGVTRVVAADSRGHYAASQLPLGLYAVSRCCGIAMSSIRQDQGLGSMGDEWLGLSPIRRRSLLPPRSPRDADRGYAWQAVY